jgi:hypothetical protein
MAPLIRPGDQVLVSKVIAEQVRFGDIVVFRRDNELIVHRILKKRRTASGLCFSEKRDTGYTYGLIGADKVVGRVTMVKGKGKILSLNSPLGRLTNLILSAWLYSAAITVNSLRLSGNKVIKLVGRVLSRLLPLTSNILVRSCFIIWYPSGLLARRDIDSN